MSTNFKNLDYLQIKESLKEHLKTLKEFQDFDFDASGIQQILSLLAYNTAYNGFYLNMVGAEMFLDTAQLRPSVTSRAKAIGYTPRSARGARAVIKIVVDTAAGPLAPNPPFIRLYQSDEFVTYLDGNPYTFTPERNYVIEAGPDGKHTQEVVLVEGKRLKYQYVVDRNSPAKQRFEIPNKNVDLSTLSVKVKDSAASSTVRVFSPASNVNAPSKDALVYYVQENTSEFYEVYFGEDIIGAQPETGNIVILEYVATNGPKVNGVKTFGRVGSPTGYAYFKIFTISPASKGYDKESIESIKLLAPLLYEAQDRAVTKNDYEALIRKDYENIQYVRVWGGEENVPPDYGKVFVAIKPKTGTRLSVIDKQLIMKRLLKERSVVSVEVKIVEPDYLFMVLESSVKFRAKTTNRKAVDIKQAVFDKIVEHKLKVLNGFDSDYSHSKLLSQIDSVDRSIVGNTTKIMLKKRIYPSFNTPTRYELKYHNPLDKGDSANGQSSILSKPFFYRGMQTFIGDDGKGGLYLYRYVGGQRKIVQTGIGSVNYETGLVVLDSLEINEIPGEDYLEIFASPATTDIITPRESILILDDMDIRVYVDAIDVQGENA